MQPLKGLDSRKSTPVDRLDVPDGNGSHNSTKTITEQTDRNGAEDDSDGTKGHIVEEVLRRKHLRGCRGIGSRCGCDSANSVLLQSPRSRIHKLYPPNMPWKLSLTTLLPPTSLKLITPGEEPGPGIADKVSDQDDESALNGDGSRFKLWTGVSRVSTHLHDG